MHFQPIDMATFPRREHYAHFLDMRLSYSVTVQIDITELRRVVKATNARTYPAQIWMLATAANQIAEFRMSRDEQGALGVWDALDPLFTVLNAETHTFSGIWTPYSEDFATFERDCLATIERYADGSLSPQPEPANVLNISSIPWVEFTGFNLNLPTDYLLPILTIGKHSEREDRTFMPLAVQVHHAVCDGWHLGQFVELVQSIADSAEDWVTG